MLVEKLMTFEEELLSEFELSVKNGDIIVDPSSDSYFSELELRFPILGSKIDWDAVSGSEREQASADAYASDCQHFFDKMMRRYGLSGQCIVIGDSAVEVALIMPVGIMQFNLQKIVSVPQHHYVIANDYVWCMSFTMEGELAFGFSERD